MYLCEEEEELIYRPHAIIFTFICSTLSLIHLRVYLVAEIHLTLTLTLTSLFLSQLSCYSTKPPPMLQIFTLHLFGGESRASYL